MVIVGPEEPLVKGIYDYFKSDAALRNIAIDRPLKGSCKTGRQQGLCQGFYAEA